MCCCEDCKWKDVCNPFERLNDNIEFCFEEYLDYDFLDEIADSEEWLEMSYYRFQESNL